MQTRRQFMKSAALTGAGLVVGRTLLNSSRALAAPPVRTPALTPYLDQMPTLVDNAIDATGGATVKLTTELITSKLHSQLPETTLFGYLGGRPNDSTSYLGPVIVAKYKVPVTATYTNVLAPDDFLKVFIRRQQLHAVQQGWRGQDPDPSARRDSTRAIMTEIRSRPGRVQVREQTQSATYPNEQPATLSWYHDHLHGDTRMNVVGGLAGGYLLRDDFDTGTNPLLPSPSACLSCRWWCRTGCSTRTGRCCTRSRRRRRTGRGSASTSVT